MKEGIMKEHIWINDKCITYELIRKKVKNIIMRINPDLTIMISANSRVSKKRIEDFLVSRADWIEDKLKHVDALEKIYFQDFKLEDGEDIRILGHNLKFKIIESSVNKVEMDQNYLYLYILDTSNKKKMYKFWTDWYESFIKENLTYAINSVHPTFYQYHNHMPNLKLRYMKTRWGTCNGKTDTITLNKFLIQLPRECIEYVVTHEFTHFIHLNHSKDFYQSLKSIMPDFKRREKMLEKYVIVK